MLSDLSYSTISRVLGKLCVLCRERWSRQTNRFGLSTVNRYVNSLTPIWLSLFALTRNRELGTCPKVAQLWGSLWHNYPSENVWIGTSNQTSFWFPSGLQALPTRTQRFGQFANCHVHYSTVGCRLEPFGSRCRIGKWACCFAILWTAWSGSHGMLLWSNVQVNEILDDLGRRHVKYGVKAVSQDEKPLLIQPNQTHSHCIAFLFWPRTLFPLWARPLCTLCPTSWAASGTPKMPRPGAMCTMKLAVSWCREFALDKQHFMKNSTTVMLFRVLWHQRKKIMKECFWKDHKLVRFYRYIFIFTWTMDTVRAAGNTCIYEELFHWMYGHAVSYNSEAGICASASSSVRPRTSFIWRPLRRYVSIFLGSADQRKLSRA